MMSQTEPDRITGTPVKVRTYHCADADCSMPVVGYLIFSGERLMQQFGQTEDEVCKKLFSVWHEAREAEAETIRSNKDRREKAAQAKAAKAAKEMETSS